METRQELRRLGVCVFATSVCVELRAFAGFFINMHITNTSIVFHLWLLSLSVFISMRVRVLSNQHHVVSINIFFSFQMTPSLFRPFFWIVVALGILLILVVLI